MSHFTLVTGQAGIVWALTLQGVGFSCLFVPLSTVALAAVPRHLMADATGLNSLFRQVGGSMGLAIAATLLSRYGKEARAALVAHVSGASQATMERLEGATRGFVAHGVDPESARRMALAALDGAVQQQTTLLAFERLFLAAGLCFLLVLPLLVFLRTPKSEGAAPSPEGKAGGTHDVHIEM